MFSAEDILTEFVEAAQLAYAGSGMESPYEVWADRMRHTWRACFHRYISKPGNRARRDVYQARYNALETTAARKRRWALKRARALGRAARVPADPDRTKRLKHESYLRAKARGYFTKMKED